MTAGTTIPETIAVSEAQRFDERAFSAYLAEKLGVKLRELHQMSGGQSNPTFLVVTDGPELVLRKQPPGVLLPSAHARDREFRALSALSGVDVPVPKTIAFCDDTAVIGTSFYLMERLRGRIFLDPLLPGIDKHERGEIYRAMATTLAKLHLVDWQAVGLDGFGRTSGYYERQLARWSTQWEKSKTRENASIDRLIEWLPQHLPPDSPAAVIHGDFRLNNIMFDPVDALVIGILDWELATLGPAVADLTHNCISYFMPPGHPSSLLSHDLNALGIPDERDYLDHYASVAGVARLPGRFHRAFALFRLAVITEGIVARAKAGIASSSRALEVGARGLQLADQGWHLAQTDD